MQATDSITGSHPVKSLRLARGLAIYGLAVRARCSPTTIGAVERWGYRSSVPVCERIAAALEVLVEVIWPEQVTDDAGA
jgi:lambda repressor-like predicted transcriptional regulator